MKEILKLFIPWYLKLFLKTPSNWQLLFCGTVYVAKEINNKKKNQKFKTRQISDTITNIFYTHQNISNLKIFKVIYPITTDMSETEAFYQESNLLSSVLWKACKSTES